MNSFEWSKTRMLSDASTYRDRPWGEAIEVSSGKFIRDGYKTSATGSLPDGRIETISIEITIDTDADYDYCTTDSVVHDGTLEFENIAISRIIERLKNAGTRDIRKPIPKGGDTVKYTIGNFVLLNEFGNFGKEAWKKQRTTVALPIKYELIRR